MLSIEEFHLYSNNLCSDIPTQVAALSSALPSYGGWDITTGNALNTPCCEAYPEDGHTCAPTALPSPPCSDKEAPILLWDSAAQP